MAPNAQLKFSKLKFSNLKLGIKERIRNFYFLSKTVGWIHTGTPVSELGIPVFSNERWVNKRTMQDVGIGTHAAVTVAYCAIIELQHLPNKLHTMLT